MRADLSNTPDYAYHRVMAEILIAAAASLTEAFTEIGRAFTKSEPKTVARFHFASSGALQQQILQGAPVDGFAAASIREMDALAKAGRVEIATRVDFASNRLVLITPLKSRIKDFAALRSPLARRIALSNPDTVPSGRYAKETLIRRGLWATVLPRAIFGENVRQTLAYVAGGDADAGLVFATDRQAARGRVRVVAEAIPGRDHAPIRYSAAVLRGAADAPAARRFIAFLRSGAAQAILKRHGFLPSPPRR